MTEFDFDELDKAVNSLMSDVDTSKRSEGLDDPEEKTVELTDTEAQPAPVSAPTATAVAQPLATKRRGQFMDFVRPADTNSQTPLKRQGMVIQPAPSVQSNNEVITPPVEPVASPDELPKEENSLNNNMNDLPDSNTSQEPEITETTEQTNEMNGSEDIQPTNPQESTDAVSPDGELPMESPFLTDAKVEKRPLGAPTDANEETSNSYASEPVESQPEPSQPAEEAPELTPQELAPEIMNIESNPVVQSTPEQEAPAPISTEALAAVESSTPTDIVPQYSESVSQNNEPSGAIYDTAAYHQPLEHPAKKRNGWLIIVWILLLLIIGAVAGAAYFYFTTQY